PSLKTRWGRAAAGEGGKSSSSTARWCGWVIRSLVFSCATTVAPPARSGALLSVWSKCQCVLITVFTGAPNPFSDSCSFGHAGARPHRRHHLHPLAPRPARHAPAHGPPASRVAVQYVPGGVEGKARGAVIGHARWPLALALAAANLSLAP